MFCLECHEGCKVAANIFHGFDCTVQYIVAQYSIYIYTIVVLYHSYNLLLAGSQQIKSSPDISNTITIADATAISDVHNVTDGKPSRRSSSCCYIGSSIKFERTSLTLSNAEELELVQIKPDSVKRSERKTSSAAEKEAKSTAICKQGDSNKRAGSNENGLALIMMGYVLVFFICHSPRLMLNIYELATIR